MSCAFEENAECVIFLYYFSQARSLKESYECHLAIQFKNWKDSKRSFCYSPLHATSHFINRNHIIHIRNMNTFWPIINN